MMPDRWALRKWAKRTLGVGYLLLALTMLLDRVREIARQEAENERLNHEWTHHNGGEE